VSSARTPMTFTDVELEAFCFCLFLPIWRAILVSYTPL
jgi:hypothetical protein